MRLHTLLLIMSVLFSLCIHTVVSANSDVPIYGPEWTFTNEALIKIQDFHARGPYLAKVMAQFKTICNRTKGCRYDSKSNEFIYENGLRLVITSDPSVIEVKAEPMSLADWEKNQDFVQKHLFDEFAKIGLYPHEREGAGHLNLGLDYFWSRPLLARNFIADFFNHPGVGTVLNSLTANFEDAPYMAELLKGEGMNDDFYPSDYTNALEELAKVDSKLESSHLFRDYMSAFMKFMSHKYIALGIRGISYDEDWRLEIRPIRPQQTMKDFVDVIRIFEARIKYLERNHNTPIPFAQPLSIQDGWVALGQFADYLEEAGLNWKDFKNLMPEMWRNLDERQFIRKKKTSAGARSCRGAYR